MPMSKPADSAAAVVLMASAVSISANSATRVEDFQVSLRIFSAVVGAEVRTPAEVSVRAARDLEQNRMPMLTPRLTLTCTRHCWAAKSCFRRETPNCACA